MTKVMGLVRDLIAAIGAGLIAYGAWVAYAPAGLMIAGLFILVAAVLHANRAP